MRCGQATEGPPVRIRGSWLDWIIVLNLDYIQVAHSRSEPFHTVILSQQWCQQKVEGPYICPSTQTWNNHAEIGYNKINSD